MPVVLAGGVAWSAGAPLLYDHPAWARASEASNRYLERVSAALVAAPDGSVVRQPLPPLWVARRADELPVASALVLGPHSVEGWVTLAFPERRIRVEAGPGGERETAAAGEVVLVLARRARGESNASGSPASDAVRSGLAPNVVLIVGDDVGAGDLGAYGARDVATPHLDRLAREGVRFEQAYASAPLCAPTRAGLLTGRDQNRYGYTGTTGLYHVQMRRDIGLDPKEILLSDLLRAAGYATGIFGKWHLGVNPHFRPAARGFDEFFGILAGAHAYFDWSGGPYGPVFRGDERVSGDEYLTAAITREAVAFVDRNAARPFFLFVPYTAIHAPYEAPEALVERFGELAEPRRTAAAMLAALDDGVGRIAARVRSAGLEDRTLFIFVSDNGGLAPASSNGNLRGGKGALLEGGIRVPLIVRWPGHVPEEGRYAAPVTTLDLLPTVLAAAGVAPPDDRALDGVDLLPYLTGRREGDPHEALFCKSGPARAVRSGNDKLVRLRGVEADALYDLASDPTESRDLAAERPERAAELARRHDAWLAEIEPR